MNTHDISKQDLVVYRSPLLGALLVYRNPLKSWLTAVLPLVAGIIYLAPFSTTPLFTVVGLMLAGAIYWTLIEYIIHRWIYHIRYRNFSFRTFIESFHMHHHRDITDGEVLNAGPLLVYPMFVVVHLPLVWMKPDDLAFLALGNILMYSFYEFVHFRIHLRPGKSRYISFIQKFHLHHHYFDPGVNFGNTSPLWDHIFRTYDPNYLQFNIEAVAADMQESGIS